MIFYTVLYREKESVREALSYYIESDAMESLLKGFDRKHYLPRCYSNYYAGNIKADLQDFIRGDKSFRFIDYLKENNIKVEIATNPIGQYIKVVQKDLSWEIIPNCVNIGEQEEMDYK